jgi:hypothetical protein
MSSELTRAIIRGFGGQIGRNLANGSRRRSYSSSPTRSVGRPAQSEFDKALKFDIGGRPSTMVSKVYNLIVEFENKISSEITNCADYDVLVTAYLKTMDKFRDTLSYLEMKGIDVEIQTQFMEMENAVKSLLKEKLTLIVQSLFNNPSLATKYSDSDLETIIKAARSVNVEMNIQATDDETGEVTQVDVLAHLIELVQVERDKNAKQNSNENIIGGLLFTGFVVFILMVMVVMAN